MQGFNMGRYYPPDESHPPRFNTTHPLGARANKLKQGILTVRFELPFPVWCQHCTPEAIIGQGVRFNAEKKRVGHYYSTPVWSFRMKHSACGGWWDIHTDPKNAEYVAVEGCRRRDVLDERGKKVAGAEGMGEGEGEMRFLTEEEREKRREDAFANLEGKVDDRLEEKKGKERVEELYEAAERWRDPYEVNARLRRDFRAGRKVRKKEERYKEGVQDKFSLGIDIADEIDTDKINAALIEFGRTDAEEQKKVAEVEKRPLFATGAPNLGKEKEPSSKTRRLKSEIRAEKTKMGLQNTLVGNTRAAVDPFLASRNGPGGPAATRPNLGLLKRKRDAKEPRGAAHQSVGTGTADSVTEEKSSTRSTTATATAAALVDYESD